MRSIPSLLRGDLESLRAWTEPGASEERLKSNPILTLHLAVCAGLIVMGAGSFGLAMGAWRSPLQAVYCGLKLPLILLLTALGNGALNAMLAPLLGLNIAARRSLLAVLTSFAIAALILGAFSPLLAFLVWNLPPLTVGAATNATGHSLILLTETLSIALAGVAANLRLAQLLRAWAGHTASARRTLFAWLAGNLFLGSQLAWIARPFVGAPDLPVEFLRATAFQGSFFETLAGAAARLISP